MASEPDSTVNEPDDSEAAKLVRELVVPDAANLSDQSGDRSPGHDRDVTIANPAVEIPENPVARELIVPESVESDSAP
jgi:hypothetical protein